MTNPNLETEFRLMIGTYPHFTDEQKLEFRAAVIAFVNTIAHAEKVPDVRSARFEREFNVNCKRLVPEIEGIPVTNPSDEYQLEEQRKKRVKAKDHK